MVVEKGGEAERFVRAAVLVVADAQLSAVEQADHGGQDLVARQPGTGQIRGDASPDAAERPPEGGEPRELHVVPLRPERGMVEVLLAAARVAADCLEVAVRRAANPDLGPRRRNDQRADASERLGVADDPPARVPVAKSAARLFARDPGIAVAR